MTSTMSIRSGVDYATSTFDIKAYLSVWSGMALNRNSLTQDVLKDLHTVFNTVQPRGVRQLDFGCGPSLTSVLSSSRHCSQIVMCEYSEQLRNEVRMWIAGDAAAHDWLPLMEHVANMEGNGMTGKDVEKRVRSSITDVIPCDILKDEPVTLDSASFDLITSAFCLGAACQDMASFVCALKKLAHLLVRDGTLVLAGVLEENWYKVGNEYFYNLYLTKKDIDESLTEAGFGPATWFTHDNDSADHSYQLAADSTGWFVAYATKQ